jgi:uncharacterized protein (TIGR02598 family)
MKKTPRHHSKAAFSLVEVTLALGVASFSLISMVALLPLGLNNAQSATMQTGAMNIIAAVAADIRITPAGTTASPRFGINPVSTTTLFFTGAGTSTTKTQSPIYQAVIQQAVPPTGTPTVSGTMEHITVTWPPLAPPSSFTGSVEVMVSLPQD